MPAYPAARELWSTTALDIQWAAQQDKRELTKQFSQGREGSAGAVEPAEGGRSQNGDGSGRKVRVAYLLGDRTMNATGVGFALLWLFHAQMSTGSMCLAHANPV